MRQIKRGELVDVYVCELIYHPIAVGTIGWSVASVKISSATPEHTPGVIKSMSHMERRKYYE